MKILICSSFFESQLPTWREYSYSANLSEQGHDVTLLCGDQSQIWKYSRVKLPVTKPDLYDGEFTEKTGVNLLRRRVFFRVSDFVLFIPSIRAIRRADIVHCIEFRQGSTMIVAMLAWLMGKPVVYDHEQRGDRDARWYSRVDAVFRRMLIAMGSITVRAVRHTVLANRDHWRKNTMKKGVREMFAPLGADPNIFYMDCRERADARAEYGLEDGQKVAIVSGKLHAQKRIPSVVQACREVGMRLILVGSMPEDVRREINLLGPGDEIIINNVDTDRLRRLYNAADIVIFTTFTLSYWEAMATGLFLVAPRTSFTELAIEAQPNVALFGNEGMFSISDEQYRVDVDIGPPLIETLKSITLTDRKENLVFSAPAQARALSALYHEVLADR
jgi:glycosyltransferase involved in cell wall biosynthesis